MKTYICCKHIIEIPSSSLDDLDKISNIIIALLTFSFGVYIFWFSNKKDNDKSKKEGVKNSLKSIILDHNLQHLFSFYDKISDTCAILLKSNLTDEQKSKLNEDLQNVLEELRLKFTDLLSVVDTELYEATIKISDKLLDDITNAMFDENINLNEKSVYSSEIITKISISKADTIKILFDFNKK